MVIPAHCRILISVTHPKTEAGKFGSLLPHMSIQLHKYHSKLYLDGRDHGAESKDGGIVLDSGESVKRPLRV